MTGIPTTDLSLKPQLLFPIKPTKHHLKAGFYFYKNISLNIHYHDVAQACWGSIGFYIYVHTYIQGSLGDSIPCIVHKTIAFKNIKFIQFAAFLIILEQKLKRQNFFLIKFFTRQIRNFQQNSSERKNQCVNLWRKSFK